jgi:hypothetical protein
MPTWPRVSQQQQLQPQLKHMPACMLHLKYLLATENTAHFAAQESVTYLSSKFVCRARFSSASANLHFRAAAAATMQHVYS